MSVLVTSRPLDEYCGLFGLTRSELRTLPGPVLDCPGGASGLVAEARALGCRAIAVDPGYAVPPPALAALARAGRETMAAAIRAEPARYLPGSPGPTATCAAGTAPGGCSPPMRPSTRSTTWPPRCPDSRSRTARSR